MSRQAILDFIHQLRYDDLPAAVIAQAKRCLLGLLGAAAGVPALRIY